MRAIVAIVTLFFLGCFLCLLSCLPKGERPGESTARHSGGAFKEGQHSDLSSSELDEMVRHGANGKGLLEFLVAYWDDLYLKKNGHKRNWSEIFSGDQFESLAEYRSSLTKKPSPTPAGSSAFAAPWLAPQWQLMKRVFDQFKLQDHVKNPNSIDFKSLPGAKGAPNLDSELAQIRISEEAVFAQQTGSLFRVLFSKISSKDDSVSENLSLSYKDHILLSCLFTAFFRINNYPIATNFTGDSTHSVYDNSVESCVQGAKRSF